MIGSQYSLSCFVATISLSTWKSCVEHCQRFHFLLQILNASSILSRIGNERLLIMKDERDIINLVWSMCRAAEWKGNWNVTYWRQKDSAPLSKLSGLSSLCKPQGESEYIPRCTPGRLEVPASQTSTLLRTCNKICDFLEPETFCLFFFLYPDFFLSLIWLSEQVVIRKSVTLNVGH